MNFDDITVLLGEFGKYQKILYFLVCLPAIFTGMQMLSSVFTLAIPSHRTFSDDLMPGAFQVPVVMKFCDYMLETYIAADTLFPACRSQARCKVPGLDNDTYAVTGMSHEITLNQTIPWTTNDDDEPERSSCDVYVTSNKTMYDASNVPWNHSSRETCHDWVFDVSTFKSTFITEENLICGQEIARANANMILMAGVLFGAIFIGVLADIFGRKKALVGSVFLQVGGAFGSAFAPNYAVFVACRFLVGMSNMGIFMSAFVIGVELVGPSKRMYAGIIIEFFWCIGLYVLCLLAYFIRDWDTLQLAMACPSVLLFLYFFIIPESPRWLISQGKYEEADKIIQKCARVNGVTLPPNAVGKDTADVTEKESVLKLFTTPRLLFRTLIIYFNWLVVSMVYYGLGLNVGNLDGDIYVNFAINSSMEFAAYVFCLLLLNKIGRKPLHAGTMILGGVACLCTIFTVLYADSSLFWITVVLSNVGKFGISAAFAVIYIWSAELFPTLVRNSGMGSSSMLARVGGMACPYIADLGTLVKGPFGKALPLIIFGGLSVLAGLLSLFLPETAGKVLPETIEDAKNFGSDDDVTEKKPSSNKYYLNTAYENGPEEKGKHSINS